MRLSAPLTGLMALLVLLACASAQEPTQGDQGNVTLTSIDQQIPAFSNVRLCVPFNVLIAPPAAPAGGAAGGAGAASQQVRSIRKAARLTCCWI